MNNFLITYHPGLVTELNTEHQQMLRQMSLMQNLVSACQIEALLSALQKFRSEMLRHVSKETTKLYIYLERSLKDHEEDYAQMKQFKRDMDAATVQILDFIDQSHDKNANKQLHSPEAQHEFFTGVQTIIDQYKHRIDLEENILFPMYRQLR